MEIERTCAAAAAAAAEATAAAAAQAIEQLKELVVQKDRQISGLAAQLWDCAHLRSRIAGEGNEREGETARHATGEAESPFKFIDRQRRQEKKGKGKAGCRATSCRTKAVRL